MKLMRNNAFFSLFLRIIKYLYYYCFSMIMSMRKDKKLIFGIGIMLAFILLILSLTMYFSYQHDIRQEERLTKETVLEMSEEELVNHFDTQRDSQTVFHSFYLLPFVAFIGLLVGLLVYYIMSDKISEKDKSLKKNSKIILNFLSADEKKVINTLMENEGRVRQYELSHLPNLNKVKTHRILFNLEQKGVIHKEKLGKINKIVLNKELYDFLR